MFGQTAESPFSFDCLPTTEALNRLLYVVDSGEPFVTLTAPDGTGKSTLLRRVRAEATQPGLSVTFLNATAQDETALWNQLCRSLVGIDGAEMSRADLMKRIRDELSGRHLCRRRTLLIIDDLHRAAEELSGAIQYLISIADDVPAGLTVIAAMEGLPDRSLVSLSALRVELQPLDTEDSLRFTCELLNSLQADLTRIAPAALQSIASFGMGYPARLLRICDLCNVALNADPDLYVDSGTIHALSGETLLSKAG